MKKKSIMSFYDNVGFIDKGINYDIVLFGYNDVSLTYRTDEHGCFDCMLYVISMSLKGLLDCIHKKYAIRTQSCRRMCLEYEYIEHSLAFYLL